MSRRWAIAAGAWWLLLLLLVPFGRSVVDALRPGGWLQPVVFLVLVSGLVAIGVVLIRARLSRRRALVVFLAATLGLYLATLLPRHEERIHVLGFSVLGAMLVGALGSSMGRLMGAAVLVAALGWADEGVQALVPSRVYDLADVWLNVLSGVAGVLVAAVGSISTLRESS